MSTRKLLGITLAAVLLVTTLPGVNLVKHALAQSGGGYDLSWFTVDGGGGAVSGGSYVLQGTIGQPDAVALTGGGYALAGGFWTGGAANEHNLFLPLILR